MSAAAAHDRLSDLPDDLLILIHILSFTPFREAASTTALSRRWRRPMWRETGVVLLDHRSSYTTTSRGVPLLRRMLDDDHRAQAFYRSLGRAPRKLTIFMKDDEVDDQEEHGGDEVKEEDVSEAEEESAGMEELRIDEIRLEWLDCASRPVHCKHKYYLGSLPYSALRVLEITGYLMQQDSDRMQPLAFPCLEALRLRRCRTSIATLHDMIFDAPKLADFRLEEVCFIDDDQHKFYVHCPTATVIVISDLHVFRSGHHLSGCRVNLDAPCVRRLVYANVVTFKETDFSFEHHLPPDLEHVYLAVHSGSTQARRIRRFLLDSVYHVRILKLTAYSMTDLDDIMQCCFFKLERLEIEDLCGWCIQNDRGVASAMVNLLGCCPRVRELKLKFSWQEYLLKNTEHVDQIAASSDFSLCTSLANENEEYCCNALELYKLRGGSDLICLQSSLRKVVVEFDTEELTCLQVRLIKFLAKNAMILEEFIVDGRKGYDSCHIDHKIARWRRRRRPAWPPLPEMTPRSNWPPLLSEFPPLSRDLDPIPASP